MEKQVVLTFDKRRDGGETGDKIFLDVEEVLLPDGESTLVLQLATSGPPVTPTEEVRKTKRPSNREAKRQLLLDTLEAFGATGARSGEWQKASGLSHGTFNRLRKAVIKKDVELQGDYYIHRKFLAADHPQLEVPALPLLTPSL